MKIKTIEWVGGSIKLIDQTKLPLKLEYLRIKDLDALIHAIKSLQVRGAPAIGAAAALGVYVGIKDSQAREFEGFNKELEGVISRIAASRPTAKNLFWALDKIRCVVDKNADKNTHSLKKIIFEQAQMIVDQDKVICRKMGAFGAQLINDGDNILTVCNAGALATVDYGTALGVIYKAAEDGKKVKVFSCETRPILQGARLTSWELRKNGIDVTLICDSMAATLMAQGKINKVIAGADRIAANGDTANKIGTYSLAILSKYHKIPFYIAAPFSTFDLAIKTGKDIPIEQRDPKEVTELFFAKRVAPVGVKVYNPAFDVTPSSLISAIITERGVIKAPYLRNVRIAFSG